MRVLALHLAGVWLAIPPDGVADPGPAVQHGGLHVPRHDGNGARLLRGRGPILGASRRGPGTIPGPAGPDDGPKSPGEDLDYRSLTGWESVCVYSYGD